MKNLIVAFAFLLLTVPCTASIITVDANGTGDYPTIQAAINAAGNYDIIELQPGTYTGPENRDIDFLGKPITIRSIDPNDPNIVANTVVDCDYSGRGFLFQSFENSNSVLTGLTVIQASPAVFPSPLGSPDPPDPPHGGGIYCRYSSPTISNCVIKWNRALGAGIYCALASPTITNCVIKWNSAWQSSGGGIYCSFLSSPKITSSTISYNFAAGAGGGIYCDEGSMPIITNCVISNNSAYHNFPWGPAGIGGGIYCSGSNPTITNSIINNNVAGEEGGGILCSLYSTPIITNCIIRNNSVVDEDSSNPQIYGSPTITYTNVTGGWEGEGNIDKDPLLTWDGHLQAGSPCINAGDPNYSLTMGETDRDGEPRIISGIIDIGPDEFIDTDGDGIPDWWEQVYFGSTTAGDPNDDPDGDEWNNLSEYTHSTEPNVTPTNYYVDPEEGSDSFDGLAPIWNGQHGPKEHIQPAIDACADRQNDIVTLAQGSYTGYLNTNISFYGKAITVCSIDPCDPCVVAETIIDCQGSVSRGFNFSLDESPASVIKGLTITNGYAFTYVPPWYYEPIGKTGGAIQCDRASPTIKLCRIIANEAEEQGGGIYCKNGSPIITNCIISGNSAEGDSTLGGGGIYCEQGNPTIASCVITENSAVFGAGISCVDNSPTITNCILSSNFASYGGGMHVSNSSLSLTNCLFSGNSAEFYGGAVLNSESTLTLTDCTFSGNSAYWSGGGITDFDGSLTLKSCKITGNSADYGAGIVCFYDSSANITNCNISGNLANYDGGGIYLSYNTNATLTNCNIAGNFAEERGGGIYNSISSNSMLTNCTFSENSALNGKALAFDSLNQSSPSSLNMTNSILWDGGNEIWNNDDSTITITYSDVQGSWIGNGNIDDDPCFVYPGYWADVNDTNIIVEPNDPNAVWIEGDYHLLEDSPCIDAANDANVYTDIEGNPRPFDFPGVDNNGELPDFDMGAYEKALPDPVDLLDIFAQDVIDLELQHGIENSLLAKLDAALQKLEDDNENNDVAAINSLQAFINAVEAQRGKKIPEEDADYLINKVLEIIELLSAE